MFQGLSIQQLQDVTTNKSVHKKTMVASNGDVCLSSIGKTARSFGTKGWALNSGLHFKKTHQITKFKGAESPKKPNQIAKKKCGF